jgi:phosphoribosylformylglycinamidine cyclo-ligase
VADVLIEPTVIYVRAVMELLASQVEVHGLAHITGGGLLNLLRIGSEVGYRIDEPLPAPGVFELIARLGGVGAAEMWQVFNMGCGFTAMVPEDQAHDAVEILAEHHPGTAVIGVVTADAGRVEVPSLGIEGDAEGLRFTGSHPGHEDEA